MLVLGVVVAAAGRGWGWKVVAAAGRQNPENKQSCSLSGLGGWWWQQQQAEGSRTPKMSSRACFQGWEDGGYSQRISEPQKRAEHARFQGWAAGRLVNCV